MTWWADFVIFAIPVLIVVSVFVLQRKQRQIQHIVNGHLTEAVARLHKAEATISDLQTEVRALKLLLTKKD